MSQRLIELAMMILNTDWEDETEAENSDFSVTQFPGTAFDSSYKCVKVITKDSFVTEDGVFPKVFVGKLTTEIEREAILSLYKKGFPVPKMYGTVTNRSGAVVIFEELVKGKEIYGDTNEQHWVEVATSIAKVHRNFWGGVHFNSKRTSERITTAISECRQDSALKEPCFLARKYLQKSPLVLAHGDLFPTNVLVKDDGNVVFIDWADSGTAPYVNDIGRLTGIIDIKTLKPFCPCEEAVIEAYYSIIRDKVDYDKFVKDFYAGQFIETAAYYSAMDFNMPYVIRGRKQYATVVRNRLLEIADKL